MGYLVLSGNSATIIHIELGDCEFGVQKYNLDCAGFTVLRQSFVSKLKSYEKASQN